MSQQKRSKKSTDIRVERQEASDKYQKHMDKLWKILASSTPEQQKQIIDQLDEKTTYLLRTQKNIYNKPVYKGHKVERLAFNIVNMKEKYLQRFNMTALIGFLYRMLDEWEPPGNKKFTSQNDPEFAKLFNAKSSVLENTRPMEICEGNIEFLSSEISKLGDAIATASDENSDLTESQILELKKDKKKRYQELFVWSAKLLKYKLSDVVKQKEAKKLKVDFAATDLDRAKQFKDLHIKRAAVLKRKVELRKTFEGSKEHSALLEKVRNRAPNMKPVYEPELDEALMNPSKTRLSDYDKEHSVKDLQTQLNKHESNIKLAEEDITKLAVKSKTLKDEYETILIANNNLDKEFTDLKLKYDKHFTPKEQKSITKAPMPRKVRKQKPQDHILDDIKIKDYELNDDEYDSIVAEVKQELNLETTREEWVEEHQSMIQSFLDEYFLYNPDNHVQCAYKPNYDDDLRTPLRTAWRDFHNGELTEAQYEKSLEEHASDVERYRVVVEEEYERSVIPPDDSFFRLQRYIDNNYEELRQATDDIYCEKSDIEWSITPLKYFTGNTADEVDVEFNEWKRKYAEEFEGDVLSATFGVWNMLGSWESNREARDFYTKNSEVIKRIIDQNKDDAKMGRRLMKQRTEQKKRENIEEAGPDASGLKSYIETTGSNLTSIGAKHAGDLDNEGSSVRPIKGRELESIHRRDESSKQEIEVGFTHIRPRKRRGKFRATTATQGKFHIPAEDHLPETGVVMKPSDMHKKLMGDEMKSSMKE